VHIRFWWGELKESAHLATPRLTRENSIKTFFTKADVDAWIGLLWLRTGAGGGRL
jgi:hypothetical protein